MEEEVKKPKITTGTYTATGNGITAQFSWEHKLGVKPLEFLLTPVTAAAQGALSFAADATRFYVNYDVCPTGALTWNWLATNL